MSKINFFLCRYTNRYKFSPLGPKWNRMTNREYMINLLLDGLESRLNRVSIDDGGASEEAMIYYNINCPYYAGDKRAYCRKEGSLVSSREVCVDCKAHWLEQEVDE